MSRLARVWRSVGVEPALCIYMVSSFVRMPVFQNLIYEKACLGRYHASGATANASVDCANVTALRGDNTLHEGFNNVYLVSSLGLLVPSMFSTAILGSLCDSWSFKIPMMVPLVGVVVGSANYVLQAAMLSWSPYWLVISDVVFGVCGGYISITSTMFGYSMRTTPYAQRSERVAALEGAIGIGSAVGSVLSGLVRNAFGYVAAFSLITLLNLVALLYVACYTKEIRPERTDAESVEQREKLGAIVRGVGRRFGDVWDVLRPTGHDRLLWRLSVFTFIALAVELFSFSGISDILFSFLRGRHGWTDKQYGLFNGLASGLGCVNILFVYPMLRTVFGYANSALAMLGIATKIVFLSLLTLARVEWLVFVAAVPMSFNRFAATGMRAMIGQFVRDAEQGRAFSLIALVESISAIAATTVFNGLYPKTLRVYDGLMFIVTAVAITIPLIILA